MLFFINKKGIILIIPISWLFMLSDIDTSRSPFHLSALCTFACIGLIVLFLSGAIEYGLFWLTLQYEVYVNEVSWYFPAGFRILLFLFLPFRYWLAAWVGVNLGNAWFYLDYLDSQMGFAYHLNEYPPYLLTMPVIAWAKYKGWHNNLMTLKTIATIIGLMVVCRIITTTHAYILTLHLYENISPNKQFEMYFAHQLGGYIGALVLLNWFYIGAWFKQQHHSIWSKQNINLLIYLSVLALTIICVFYVQPNSAYLMKMFAFVPIMWFAHRFRFIGILSSVCIINSILLIYLFNIDNGATLLVYQPYIIAYFLVCFLVGGVVLEHDRAQTFLSESNAVLTAQNDEYATANQTIHKLANRIIELQEYERKALSQELHDELGQNITTLNTQLSIIERSRTLHPETSLQTNILKDSTQHMLTNVNGLTGWLTHDELTQNGVSRLLTGEYFSQQLHNAGITYLPFLTGPLDTLPKQYQIMLFRIVQEAITNTIKYADADTLWLTLVMSDDELKLSVHDNGIGFELDRIAEQASFGLDGIRNRVMALDGKVTFTNDKGAVIEAAFSAVT